LDLLLGNVYDELQQCNQVWLVKVLKLNQKRKKITKNVRFVKLYVNEYFPFLRLNNYSLKMY